MSIAKFLFILFIYMLSNRPGKDKERKGWFLKLTRPNWIVKFPYSLKSLGYNLYVQYLTNRFCDRAPVHPQIKDDLKMW